MSLVPNTMDPPCAEKTLTKMGLSVQGTFPTMARAPRLAYLERLKIGRGGTAPRPPWHQHA